MMFSSTMSFLLYLNGHEDGSAYKDIRISKKNEEEDDDDDDEEEKD